MKRNLILIGVFVLIFIASRFLVFSDMYHQDEYKWALIVNPAFGLDLRSDHPPLIGFLYRMTGFAVGFENLRLLPIAVSIINVLLVLAIVRRMYGKDDPAYGRRAVWWTFGILLLNTYFLIASTQVDIDGALLPCAMLLSLYCFIHINWSDLSLRDNRKWYVALFAAIVFGCLIKLSFALVLAALATEFWIIRRPNWKLVGKIIVWGFGAFIVAAGIIWLLNSIGHVRNASQFLLNATKFGLLNFGERNYFQVLFLSVKSFVVASPLLLLPALYILVFRDKIREHRFWFIYIVYNVIFYFVIFDFTSRTIERYMMFLIIPCSIISGVFLSRHISFASIKENVWKVLIGVTLGLSPLLSLLCTYVILPLNPKSAYIAKLTSFDFRFLIPITGGSGPIGFYVPVLFVVLSFVVAVVALVVYRYAKNVDIKKISLTAFVVLGLIYNVVLMSEYGFGTLYGNVDAVSKQVTNYVVNDSKIDEVITYYDTAGYELNVAKKYKKRFYTDPMFAASNVGKFAEHGGYYSVVDFPEIDKNSVYWKYLSSCATVFTTQDRRVHGYVFDCKAADTTIFGTK